MWPAPLDLAPFVAGLHLYVLADNAEAPYRGAFEPAFAGLRFSLSGAEGWRLRFKGGDWFRPPAASLFGPNRTVIWSESGPGVLVSGSLRPRGWLRLFDSPANAWTDRVDRIPLAGIDSVMERMRSVAQDEALPAIYFDFLRGLLTKTHPAEVEEEIAAIEAALVDPATVSVQGIAEANGMTMRRLQRLCLKAFGFPPKLLLRRARFLRSLHALRAARRGERALVIDPAYTDYSHFARDAQDFLGMPPQAFVDTDMPLLRTSLALRNEVIGAPAQALDAVSA